MFHTCVQKFDVMCTVDNFFGKPQQSTEIAWCNHVQDVSLRLYTSCLSRRFT